MAYCTELAEFGRAFKPRQQRARQPAVQMNRFRKMTTTELIKSEAQALQERREELAELETRLAERESQLAKLRGEMSAFESRYLKTVGGRYNELGATRPRRLDLDEQVDSALSKEE